MFNRGALGAALLAAPLAVAAGQSTTQHPPPATATADSSGGHRFAWVVGAGASGAAVFTTFVRMSERGATVHAERGLTLPGSPVPNHYTDGSLPGSGVSPGQNAPPPGQALPPSQDSSTSGGTTQTQGSGTVGNDPGPGPIITDPPPPTDDSTPSDPTEGDQSTPPQPPAYQPPGGTAIVVTTPEPESIFLLGTGVIALIPAVRRRRSAA